MSREEDPGLLGQLPRSRPGRRSVKRPGAPGAPPAAAADAPPAPAERPDPVGNTLRAAAGLAGAGLRIADGMTRELLRRLPLR